MCCQRYFRVRTPNRAVPLDVLFLWQRYSLYKTVLISKQALQSKHKQVFVLNLSDIIFLRTAPHTMLPHARVTNESKSRFCAYQVGDGSTKTAFQVKLEINLCACISSALHRCLRETRAEELVCFSFSEVCVKTIWSSRSESCLLTYRFACTLATLGIMLNIAEVSHDLIFFKVSAFAVFLRFRVF